MRRLHAFVILLLGVVVVCPTQFAGAQTISDDDVDTYPPMVGIHNFQPICANNTDPLDIETQRGCEVRQRLIAAMETDELLKGG